MPPKGSRWVSSINQQLRPDAKGQINLGKLAQGVSSFRAHRTEEGNIILEPFAEIPAREKWLVDNRVALEAVQAGLQQAAAGQTRTLGSFGRHLMGLPIL